MKRTTVFLLGVILGGVGVYGFLLNSGMYGGVHGPFYAQPFPAASTSPNWLDTSEELVEKMGEITSVLEKEYHYLEDLEIDKMAENAIKGYVDALGDPHSIYLTAEESTSFEEDMEGSKNFEGIGAIVLKKEDGILIEEVLKGSPAFNAGLQPLDIIYKIDGELTQSLELIEGVNKIRGPKGTDVVLTIFREGAEIPIQDITVTRGDINIPSVEVEELTIEGKTILYINVAIFAEDTIRTMLEAVREYQVRDGVILDLRGNGGGLMSVAKQLASYFIPKDDVIAMSKYRSFDGDYFFSEGFGEFQNIPVVVLVDGLSASSSEIVAAAIRDNERGLLVGTETFGKGSIQTVYTDYEDGSALKFTIGEWYTPGGKSLTDGGLLPDREVVFDFELYEQDGTDTQLEVAKEEIGKLID